MKGINKDEFFKTVEYTPHKSQRVVHMSNGRFRVVVAGRRFGKSLMASRECMARMIYPNQRVWIVAPSYDLTRKVFREVYWGFAKYIKRWVKKLSDADLKIELVNGSVVECKSADNPVSLIGEGVDFLIIDECSRIPEAVWTEALRPCLTDTKGDVLLISTPQGFNWFQKMFIRGEDPNEKDYKSWQFPSSSNPHLDIAEIEEARRTIPERVFRQEYLAEFISDSGTVFRNIDNCIKGCLEDPHPKGRYAMGVDIGRHMDYTVIIVLRLEDNYSQVVYFEKFNKISWTLQKQKICNVAKKYHCPVIVDSSGVGDSVYEDLSRSGLSIRGFKICSNAVKNLLIENLIIALENEIVGFPNLPELVNELRAFGFKYSQFSGRTIYGAAVGHDDAVISLALVHHLSKHEPLVTNIGIRRKRESTQVTSEDPYAETVDEKLDRLKRVGNFEIISSIR